MKTKEAPVRTWNDRPGPDEQCPCGNSPAWVRVEIYEDGSKVRVPVCGVHQ